MRLAQRAQSYSRQCAGPLTSMQEDSCKPAIAEFGFEDRYLCESISSRNQVVV